MKKRILSMLLAIVMVVGMMHGMSITTNAASATASGTEVTVTGSGTVNKSTFGNGSFISGIRKNTITYCNQK